MAREHNGVLLQLRQDEAGNVFPLTAAAIFVLAGLVGGGVDASRAYLVENKLQNACDAGVLAGRKNVGADGFDETASNAAKSYFEVNMAGAADIPEFTPSSTDNGNTIEATVSTAVDMTLMRIFGIDSIPVSVSCSASMAMGNADVMMVLDTTGSMNWTVNGNNTSNDSERRITFLRSAMMDFYDTVAESADGTNARIRYGFVPYSSSVNVGALLNADWIVDRMDIQSRVPEFNTRRVIVGYEEPVFSEESGITDVEFGDWRLRDSGFNNENRCRNSLPNNERWTDSGERQEETINETSTREQRITKERDYVEQKRRVYGCGYDRRIGYYSAYRDETRIKFEDDIWTEDPIYEDVVDENDFRRWKYVKVDNIDVSRYKRFEPTAVRNRNSDAGWVSYTWQGCIEERKTSSEGSFSFDSSNGMSPYTWDLDIDSAPDGSDNSKWRPFWPERSYFRGENRWNDRRNRWETVYFIQDEGYQGMQSNAYCPSQASLLAEMDRDDFEDQADALTPNGSTYLDLGLLWGGRLLSPTGIFRSNVLEQPRNGAEVSRHLIFLTDGEMQPSSVVYSSYGFELYDKRVTDNGQSDLTPRHTSRFRAICQAVRSKGIRIWVIAFGSELNADLQFCASPESSFQASNSAELNEAFQDIAKNVGELRITM